MGKEIRLRARVARRATALTPKVFFERVLICVHKIDIHGRVLTTHAAGLDLAGVRDEEDIRDRFYPGKGGGSESEYGL